jgi:hypothetical protein
MKIVEIAETKNSTKKNRLNAVAKKPLTQSHTQNFRFYHLIMNGIEQLPLLPHYEQHQFSTVDLDIRNDNRDIHKVTLSSPCLWPHFTQSLCHMSGSNAKDLIMILA